MAHTKNKKKDKIFLLYFRVGHGGLCRRTAVRILIGHVLDSVYKSRDPRLPNRSRTSNAFVNVVRLNQEGGLSHELVRERCSRNSKLCSIWVATTEACSDLAR